MRNWLGYGQFVFLWVGLHLGTLILATVSLLVLFVVLGIFGLMAQAFALPIVIIVLMLWGAVVGLLLANGQRYLLGRIWRVIHPAWFVVTAVGSGLGVLLTSLALITPLGYFLQTMSLPDTAVIWAYGALVFMLLPVAVGTSQLLVVVRYVRGAWLWVLAHAVGGLAMYALFGSALRSTNIWEISWMVFASMVALPIVTGFTSIWLWQFNRR